MRRLWIPITLALLTATAMPANAALAADPVPPQERLLHDHDEDPLVILLGVHGHDLLALDAREVWDPFYGEPMLVLALTMDGGCNMLVLTPCEDLHEAVTFKIGSTEHNLTYETDDNMAWTGNMDRYSASTNGTVITVEGSIRFSRLQAAPGMTMTDIFVAGRGAGQPADNMPEGLFPGFPDPLEAAYSADYTLRYPDYYADIDITPTQVDLSAADGVETTVKFEVTNPLDVDQNMSMDFLAAPGLEARFIDGASRTISMVKSVAANSTEEYSFVVSSSQSGISRDLTIRMLSEEGGIHSDTVRIDVEPAPQPPVTTTSTSTVTQTVTTGSGSSGAGGSGSSGSSTTGASDESEDSPAFGLVAGLAALGAVAVIARRRL